MEVAEPLSNPLGLVSATHNFFLYNFVFNLFLTLTPGIFESSGDKKSCGRWKKLTDGQYLPTVGGVGGVDCHLLNIRGHIQKGVWVGLNGFFPLFKIEISSKTRYLVT